MSLPPCRSPLFSSRAGVLPREWTLVIDRGRTGLGSQANMRRRYSPAPPSSQLSSNTPISKRAGGLSEGEGRQDKEIRKEIREIRASADLSARLLLQTRQVLRGDLTPKLVQVLEKSQTRNLGGERRRAVHCPFWLKRKLREWDG